MADFPAAIFTPRTTANLPGVVYDAAKTKEVFAEDYSKPAAEIAEIETILGTNPQGAYATVKAWLTALAGALSGKEDALGFTPENVANKKTTLADNSDTYYPSQKAVKTAVDGKVSSQWVDGGSGKLYYNSGNVGIGTTAPGAKLHIYNDANSNTTFMSQNPNTGAAAVAGQEVDSDLIGFDMRAYGSGFNTYTHAGIALTQSAELWADTLSGTGPQALLIGIKTTKPLIFATNNAEAMRIDGTGNVGIGTTSPSGKLDVNDDHIRVRTAKTPASAGAAGNAGDIAWDSGFVYVCVATNSWVRAALAAW